jgi:hypothetical protein
MMVIVYLIGGIWHWLSCFISLVPKKIMMPTRIRISSEEKPGYPSFSDRQKRRISSLLRKPRSINVCYGDIPYRRRVCTLTFRWPQSPDLLAP